MRILFVTQRYRPLVGGAETVLSELASELVVLGSQVTVLTARWERDWLADERVNGVGIVRLRFPRIRFWGTWRFMRAIEQWL